MRKYIVVDNLVWVYINATKVRHQTLYYVMPVTYMVYSLKMFDRDGKLYEVKIHDEDEGKRIMRAFSATAPFIMFGYNASLAHMHKKNFSEMVRIVDERKQKACYCKMG